MRHLLFYIICSFFAVHLQAQIPNNQCVDSNRVDRFFQCNDPTFMPVCGCDNNTYRNECAAFRNHGVNVISYSGVCVDDFVFHAIYSNTVTAQLNLFVQFYKASAANIQIRDSYGKLMLNNNYLNIDSRQFTFYVSDYTPGMYFVFISSGGAYSIEKFVKL